MTDDLRVQGRAAARLLILALAIVLLLGLLASSAPLPAVANEQGVLLHLLYATFDPLFGPPLSAAGGLIEDPQDGRHPYIVQFVSPILPDWNRQTSATGAQIVDYLPDYAYVTLADQAEVARLRALPFVRWVGYLQPVYRVAPALLSRRGDVTVTISLFSIAQQAAVGDAIHSGGGALLPANGGGPLLRASVDAQAIPFVAALPGVAWIEEYHQARLWNDVARNIVGAPPVWVSHDLRGQGQTIAIADTGLDTGDLARLNADFRGRVAAAFALGRLNTWSDPDGHGTHVAASAVGSGQNSGSNPGAGEYGLSHAGIAPEANLIMQSVLDGEGRLGGIPDDLSILLQQAYDAGARVHSNSWGVAVADGGRVYDSQAQQVDRFAWEHPDMVVVFAAGNDGQDANRDGMVDLGSVTTPATAKNAVSVGASESVRLSGGYTTGAMCETWGQCWPDAFSVLPLRDDPLSNNANGMAAFSSRGPTPDGRLKPDLVAPGTNIISARSALAGADAYWGIYDDFYAYSGGTSTAAPLVAGAAAIVRQYYQAGGAAPSAALVKATLLAGALDLTPGQYAGKMETPDAPNVVEGWGRLDLSNALFPAAPRVVTHVDETLGLLTGQSMVYTYTVTSSDTPLRIVLAWTDFPGSLLSAANLVNDLDLHVTASDDDVEHSEQVTDHRNNVEGLILAEPEPGVYRVVVRAANVPFGPQPFALVVSGGLLQPAAPPSLAFSSAPAFGAAGSEVTIGWMISGGDVITATSLLWDVQSHASDRAYTRSVTPAAAVARSNAAGLTLPLSGTVYMAAHAWIDGEAYLSPEHAITVVTTTRRMFLPLVQTYPLAQVTPTPQATTTPAAAMQLIRNGGFEDAAPQSPPWRQYDRADPAAGLLVSDFWPRSGLWSAWLGGVYSGLQRIDQVMTPPAGATHAVLVFHWYMNTEDDEEDAHDVLTVRLHNVADQPLATILRRDNTSTRNNWVTTRYAWVGDFPFGGQSIRLSFEMVTDATKNTNLYIDDIAFFFSSAPIANVAEGVTESPGR